MDYKVTIQNTGRTLRAPAGETLLGVLQRGGAAPDAPCGGHGTCGKCRVLVDGKEQLACGTKIDRDITVTLPEKTKTDILTASVEVSAQADGECDYAAAFDVGTTTVVCYLLSGRDGHLLAQASAVNPQTRYGADVISRIQYAMEQDAAALSGCIRHGMEALLRQVSEQAAIDPAQIGLISIVGNTAMHHLLLGIDPKSLTVPPYMPKVSHAMDLAGKDLLPVCPGARVRMLPNIAGFVGADTVGCLVATRFDRLQELTLMIDIGTNGEMVLGDSRRRIACSTAAGPAFEGAKIQCGMRGAVGAVDHVAWKDGNITFSVIGGGEPVGLCGSGLLDLVTALLQKGDIGESGRMECGDRYTLEGTAVFLTQKDVREVQLAKAAIRAGIELMCRAMGVTPADIRRVYLAGAFGNYLDPASACAIGMIPPVLLDRIQPIGNAAGAGARLCAVSAGEFQYSTALAQGTEFLELASRPEFNDTYVDCLMFEEDE
ncbi:MAG: ASKHA domain-containing protein [Eubacteriales bacterium]|nr:ASKHA domain-containing protein [Eubacteriales bacterium]